MEQLSNRTASVYLRALLLTGARREELAALTWANVDFQWRKLTIADKVDITRTIPLAPYMAHLLAGLPRVGPHVFASTGKAGRIVDARGSHAKALQSASIESLTIHGLRRSFSLLGESAGAPAGAIVQVMGHKPSATAERATGRAVSTPCARFWSVLKPTYWSRPGCISMQRPSQASCALCSNPSQPHSPKPLRQRGANGRG